MKPNRTLLNWLAAGSLALIMVTTATAEAAKQRIVQAVRIKGSARYSTGNNLWQPLKVGTELKAGSIIQTASGSTVDFVIADAATGAPSSSTSQYISYSPTVQRDVVRMQPDTVLAIEKLTSKDTGTDKVTETELDLRSGRIVGVVKKVSAASTFEIKVPNGVAGIRGTFFTVSASGTISVWDGSVAVAVNTPQGPKVITVDQGFQYDISTGELKQIPPGQPVEGKPNYVPAPTEFLQAQPILYISPVIPSTGGS